ncbi:hypothetical protein GCM10010317_092190 [Streptomyces mirabilis]|nr:hypothetical protein GCM10010317_092190 [Streptomyces mirabilis]
MTDRWGTARYGRLSGLLAAPATTASALAPFAGAALAVPPGWIPADVRHPGRPLPPGLRHRTGHARGRLLWITTSLNISAIGAATGSETSRCPVLHIPALCVAQITG